MNPDAAVGIVAKSLVPESSVAAPLSSEQTIRNQHAAEVRSRYEATKATEPYAALLAGLLAPKETGLSTLDVDKEVGRRISETPPKRGVRDLRGEAIRAANEAKIIAEKGLDGIKKPDGTPNITRQDEIVNDYVARVLDRRTGLDILTPDEKVALAREELGRPEIRAKITELLKAKLDPSVETETEDDRTLAAKSAEKATKEKELTDKQTAITNANQELLDLRTKFARYQTDPTTGTDGDLLVRLKEAYGRIDIANAKTLRAWVKTTYGNNSNQYAADRTTIINSINNGIDIDSADTNSTNIRDLLEIEAAQAEYNRLSAERAALPQAILGKTAEIATFTAEQTALTLERTAIEVQIAPLAQKRLAREIALAGDLSQLAANAGNEVLDAKMIASADIYREVLAEKETAAKDRDEKTLMSGLQSRWVIGSTARDGKPIFKPIKGQIETDWKNAITSGDVMQEVEKLLTGSHTRILYTAASTPEEIQRANEEIARIKERLKTDKTFADHAKAEYLIALIGKRLESANALSSREQRLVEGLGWTDYASEYMERRTERRTKRKTELKEKTEKLFEKAGGIDSKKLSNLREQYGNNWGIILPLLMSGLSDSPKLEKYSGRRFNRLRRRPGYV